MFGENVGILQEGLFSQIGRERRANSLRRYVLKQMNNIAQDAPHDELSRKSQMAQLKDEIATVEGKKCACISRPVGAERSFSAANWVPKVKIW